MTVMSPQTTITLQIPMPNFFYLDQNNQKQGPVTDQQLKALAAQGVINPNTPLETDNGHKGTAGQIPGLRFNTADRVGRTRNTHLHTHKQANRLEHQFFCGCSILHFVTYGFPSSIYGFAGLCMASALSLLLWFLLVAPSRYLLHF